MTEYPDDRARYAPVPVSKFVALYVVTFGIYGLVWFYRNWWYIKRRDRSDIMPWVRTLLVPPIWYYFLLIDLQEEEGVWAPGWLAVGYFVFLGASRFADPYWLVSLLGFLALLPPLLGINRLAREDGAVMPGFAQWRVRNVVFLMSAGSVLVALTILGTVGPEVRVVPGAEVRARHLAFLQEIDLINTPEEVQYFYSPGVLSVRGEGTVLTATGVSTYWTDPATKARMVVVATWDEIANVEPAWSDVWYEDTVVRVTLRDGTEFVFLLAIEADDDHRFVEELERRRSRGPVEVAPVD